MSISGKTHIAHVLHAFATGGLENGVVNIINRLPEQEYHHSIICVTDHDEQFFQRITTQNVAIYDLHKPAGNNPKWLFNCWRLLKQLKPDICHTRNLSAIEAQLPAWLAGVNYRIHGEHGWDVSDLGGTNVKYQKLRKLFKPLVHQYIGLSSESINYLTHKINVSGSKINHICNGVDIDKFSAEKVAPIADLPESFKGQDKLIFGTVGRLAEVKNQTYLLSAFIELWQANPQHHNKLRLLIVGEGGLRTKLENMISQAGLEEAVYLAGLRKDIPALMTQMNVFVLPSLAEGISNTILEAMASGLPVIATQVGGNPDLIHPEHQNSHLVAINQAKQLASAMQQYLDSPEQLTHDSALVKDYCHQQFSIERMVANYHQVYQQTIETTDHKESN
ncbi:MAG: TIGR03088 family PEP-CTERM/XrtA system glycosyltransferase [Pseudoalteromonas spongiae]